MEQQNDILKELETMGSSLAKLSREMPFEVPVGYFETLPYQVLQNHMLQTIISIDATEVNDAWGKQLPFSVPENYFERLPAEVMAAINAENVLPVLVTNPYIVPEQYFDTLPYKILGKINEPNKIRIKRRNNNVLHSLRWAAAAALIVGIVFGSYSRLNRHPHIEADGISSISKNEIDDYVMQHADDFDFDSSFSTYDPNNVIQPIQQLNKDEIKQYFDEMGWDPRD